MYSKPTQFEPLIPSPLLPALLEKAAEIATISLRLTSAAHPSARATIRELVRSMNSYYSNRIEGQGTHPQYIERALHREFSDQPDISRLQRLALAHIDAERDLEFQVLQGQSVLSSQFLFAAHKALYSRPAQADRLTDDGLVIMPGELRQQEVEGGRHVPPSVASLPSFLARMDQVYTHLGERTSRALLSRLLSTGLLASDTALGPLRFGLPLDALQFLFPELYPEAATKPDQCRAN